MLLRYHRVCQFGSSEIARVSQNLELGHTDLHVSVRPKSACAMAKAESVRPIPTVRSVRDEFCGELTLKFSNQSRPKEVFAGWINLNRGKKHDIVLVLGIGVKKTAQGVEHLP